MHLREKLKITLKKMYKAHSLHAYASYKTIKGTINTAISLTCSCLISFVDEPTGDAEAGADADCSSGDHVFSSQKFDVYRSVA